MPWESSSYRGTHRSGASGGRGGSGAPAHARTRTSARSATLGQEVPQDDRRPVPTQREVRREVPAGEIDVRAGGLDLGGNSGQGRLAVDEDPEAATFPRRRAGGGPSPRRRVQSCELPDPPQATLMVAADSRGDDVTKRAVEPREEGDHPDRPGEKKKKKGGEGYPRLIDFQGLQAKTAAHQGEVPAGNRRERCCRRIAQRLDRK